MSYLPAVLLISKVLPVLFRPEGVMAIPTSSTYTYFHKRRDWEKVK